jgi:hypothetical protein
MLSFDRIRKELSKSDRWGINAQPEDMNRFARVLARLGCKKVIMKRADLCRVSFERPLTPWQRRVLYRETHLSPKYGEDPFVPETNRMEAFLWWD